MLEAPGSPAGEMIEVERLPSAPSLVTWPSLLLSPRDAHAPFEKRFMSDVAEGVVYVNGERMKRGNDKAAA